jgi:hypothetical protein
MFGCPEEYFLTIPEMQQLMQKLSWAVQGHFVSSKDDWDLYARPPIMALQDMVDNKQHPEVAPMMLDGFKMEFSAAGIDWNDVLWVLKPL